MASSRYDLKSVSRDDLSGFVSEYVRTLTEEEALAVLENPYITPAIIQKIAHVERLAAYYSVRLRMVAHRLTPQAYAVKFVHYLYWFDLVRLSVEVTVPAPVRRAIDNQLVARVGELTAGERIASARRCSPALIKAFLFDDDARVFEALLVNQRLREDDLLHLASSTRATPEKLALLVRWHASEIPSSAFGTFSPLRRGEGSRVRELRERQNPRLSQSPAFSIPSKLRSRMKP